MLSRTRTDRELSKPSARSRKRPVGFINDEVTINARPDEVDSRTNARYHESQLPLSSNECTGSRCGFLAGVAVTEHVSDDVNTEASEGGVCLFVRPPPRRFLSQFDVDLVNSTNGLQIDAHPCLICADPGSPSRRLCRCLTKKSMRIQNFVGSHQVPVPAPEFLDSYLLRNARSDTCRVSTWVCSDEVPHRFDRYRVSGT